jgi:ABC-type transport system involved in cytochrome c biogenesis ATPase subunit
MPFAEADYERLLRYLLEDAGLVERTAGRPLLTEIERSARRVSGGTPRPVLVGVSRVRNVNALVPDQTLTFGHGLTVIYGENATGKTGYARLLGCAGFTRDEQELLPDVFGDSGAGGAAPSAEFSIEIEGKLGVHAFRYGAPTPTLQHLYVFDNASAEKYLTAKTAFSFSPAGLDCLDTLSVVVDHVGALLQKRIEEWRRPLDLAGAFAPSGQVHKQLTTITAKTKLDSIRQLATLTAAEQGRIDRLDTEIAELKLAQPSAEIAKLQEVVADLRTLEASVQAAETSLNDGVLAEVAQLANRLRTYRERAAAAEAASAGALGIATSGTSVWRQMVDAARILVSGDDTATPALVDGDLCPLCRQTLGVEARELLTRLWAAITDESQQLLAAIRRDGDAERRRLAAVRLDFLGEQTIQYRRLQEADPSLLQVTRELLAVAERRRQWALALLSDDGRETVSAPALPTIVLPRIAALIETAEHQIGALRSNDPTAAIAAKESERQTLTERRALAQHLDAIEEYIRRLNWAENASRLRPRTTNITMKRKELFTSLVTAGYIDQFQRTLAEMKRPLHVKVVTSDAKGRSYKQIALDVAAGSQRGATPERVLSEGEQRVVALADFLTEVALDENSAGIVLDDPVLSLDADWEDAVAQRLVSEAGARQVIVFTHSLAFVQSLQRHSEREQAEIVLHRLRRDAATGRTGYVSLNEMPSPA